jgi:hypothetical protein
MATYELRPLGVGEILDRSITLYRGHFGILFAVAAVCQGPAAVLNLYVTLGGGVIRHPVVWGAAAVISVFGYLLAAGATLRVISEAYLGHAPVLGEALRFAVRKMWPLFVAGGTSALLSWLASLLLIVPGIIVGCGYAVVSQVVVLEPLERPIHALRRSWALTKGDKGRAFAIGFVTFALVLVPAAFIGFVLHAAPVAGGVLGQLLDLVIRPVIACAFTLFYYDLRVRKEAFDLELLSQQLGLPAATA